MKEINVTIKGKTPLLMHRFPMVAVEAMEKKTPGEQAEYAAYRDEKSKMLYIPAICIQRALISGAVYSKGKGRASLQKVVAAAVFVAPEIISLGTKEYEVDARSVVIPATKGRVIRYRPRLDEWECSFALSFEEKLLTENQMRRVVDDTLELVGLLEFRPEKKGPFGRAMVTEWA